MKVANVTYAGTMRSDNRRCPSGEIYRFRNPMGGSPTPISVESLQDAEYFEGNDIFEVEWTAQGEILRQINGPASSAKDALMDLSYRQKQKMVSALGLEVKGNAPKEELEEALEPVVAEMAELAEQR
jgi:hypothetical protein